MEKEFVDGLIIKAPREGAPDFVKANISIKREELIEWLGKQEGEWINLNVLASKKDPSKWYAEVDNWKPKTEEKKEEKNDGDEIATKENLPF